MSRIVKTDLISHLAGCIPGMTKSDAGVAIDLLLGRISEEVAAGNDVTINGFGTFGPRDRPARVGRNPKTGAAITIAASNSMGFRPSKTKPQA